MKNEKANPHDRFFKETLADVETMRDFLRNYAPPEIVKYLHLETVERLEDSFIDNDLQEHLSDLLFKVKLANREAFIYVLLEHKSSPDGWVAFQILRYLVRIWEKSQKDGKKKLPLVIPIVFYHGKTRWRFGTNFNALFEKESKLEELKRFVPSFEYHLCDLSQIADEDLKGEPRPESTMRLLKYIFRAELSVQTEAAMRVALEKLAEPKVLERWRVMINYLLQTGKMSPGEIGEILNKVSREEGAKTMRTVIDDWIDEGIEIGIQKGRQEGLRQGEANLVWRILRRKCGELSLSVQTKIQSLSSRQIENLSEDLLDFKGVADLEKWLKKHASDNS